MNGGETTFSVYLPMNSSFSAKITDQNSKMEEPKKQKSPTLTGRRSRKSSLGNANDMPALTLEAAAAVADRKSVV